MSDQFAGLVRVDCIGANKPFRTPGGVMSGKVLTISPRDGRVAIEVNGKVLRVPGNRLVWPA